MAEYLTGGYAYATTIQTFVGFGGDETKFNYLLDSIISQDYPFYKPADVVANVDNGIITFDQSYIMQDSVKKPWNTYEVTIKDVESDLTYVYYIDDASVVEGVRFDKSNNKIYYTLPKELTITTNDGDVVLTIDENKEYQINIRATSTGTSDVLRGTYYDENVLTFTKALGIQDASVKIEDGVLKWVVKTVKGSSAPISIVKVSNSTGTFKDIEVLGNSSTLINEDENYSYYEFTYEFIDLQIDFETTGKAYIDETDEYDIYVYVKGDSRKLNSNISETLKDKQRLAKVGNVQTTAEQDENDNYQTIITWDAVNGAVSYDVTFNGKTVNVSDNFININDLDYELEIKEENTIKIKAIGLDKINSILTSFTFDKLDAVLDSSIGINDRLITWAGVENADAYVIALIGEGFKYVEKTNETSFDTSSLNVQGKIEGYIIAINEGEYINSDITELNIEIETPQSVSSIEHDDKNYRYVIDVGYDLSKGDKVVITYKLQRYTASGLSADAESKEEDVVQYDSGNNLYYYPTTIVGAYSNVSVKIVRNGTLSSDSVEADSCEFELFSYGEGTTQNPYMIGETKVEKLPKAEIQLFNIEKFPNAKYKLSSSIDLSNINIEERLTINDGAIITKEFSGVLDGDSKQIYGFGGEHQNLTSFALFKTLNGATINNLFIGSKGSQIVLTNTINQQISSDVKVSLLANNAQDSTINNVTVMPTTITLTGSSAVIGNIYVSGLINTMNNTTISYLTIGSREDSLGLTVNIEVDDSNYSYVSGAISFVEAINETEESNVSNSDIIFALNSSKKLDYVGGVFAYYIGVDHKHGIVNTDVNISTSVKSECLGAVVGFARYVLIDNCESSGTLGQQGINYSTYMGGIVGWAQSSIIQNSGSIIDFDVNVSNINGVYIGAIVGFADQYDDNEDAIIDNCYWNGNHDGTDITNGEVNVGVYGGLNGITPTNLKTAKDQQ